MSIVWKRGLLTAAADETRLEATLDLDHHGVIEHPSDALARLGGPQPLLLSEQQVCTDAAGQPVINQASGLDSQRPLGAPICKKRGDVVSHEPRELGGMWW